MVVKNKEMKGNPTQHKAINTISTQEDNQIQLQEGYYKRVEKEDFIDTCYTSEEVGRKVF